jgi:hypothetical protein
MLQESLYFSQQSPELSKTLNSEDSPIKLFRVSPFSPDSAIVSTNSIGYVAKHSLESSSASNFSAKVFRKPKFAERFTLITSNPITDSREIHENHDFGLKRSINRHSLASEKHLKQYDELLKIKEHRLKQQENTIKNDRKVLEQEKKELELERMEILRSKEGIEENSTTKKGKELNRKPKHARTDSLLSQFDNLNDVEKGKKTKTTVLISREKDIQRLITELQSQTNNITRSPSPKSAQLFKVKQAELLEKEANLKKIADKLNDLKEKMELEQKNNFLEFESRLSALKKAESKLTHEKTSFELKKSQFEQKILSQEQKKDPNENPFLPKSSQIQCQNKEIQVHLLSDQCSQCSIYLNQISTLETSLKSLSQPSENPTFPQIDSTSLQNQIEFLENKLKIVECSREETESQNSELKSSLFRVKSSKKALKSRISELEQILHSDSSPRKIVLSELSDDYNKLWSHYDETLNTNKILSQNLAVLTLKCEELEKEEKKTDFNEKTLRSQATMSEEIKTVFEELQNKLEIVKNKEKELNQMREIFSSERENLALAAEYATALHKELREQKEAVEGKKEENERQRKKIMDLEAKQTKKVTLLINKENELKVLREKLEERERLLGIKEKYFNPDIDVDL